ncbi:peptidase inhibitor family I36 protein [Streptomyces chrestomyceticus]|uniref:peptidase inhibitor family I36 protein n=1 Tax=Streptomyces chrestomyceticus TaxID=68185 RepID=UPI00142F15CC|nr:peptidase inhibitor family I36 protein [Streptomyces chrestomyceticus]
MQQQIDEVLAKTEGGVQISRNEIAWEEGSVIEAFPLPGETHAPPSSQAAQELQAKASGLPVGTRESSAAMRAYDAPLTAEEEEPIPSGEEEPPGTGAVAADNCPTVIFGKDWYCFYQYKNFGGRRLQWRASYVGPAVMFSKYDFVNRTSSWSNKGGLKIHVYGRTRPGDDSSCFKHYWTENEHERSGGAYPDNAADCFRTSLS